MSLSYFNQLQKLESEIVSLLETRKGETDLYRSIRAVSMQPTFEKAADIEQKMMSLLFPSQHLQYRSIKKGIEDWLMIQECLQEDLTAEIIEVKASDSSVL